MNPMNRDGQHLPHLLELSLDSLVLSQHLLHVVVAFTALGTDRRLGLALALFLPSCARQMQPRDEVGARDEQ